MADFREQIDIIVEAGVAKARGITACQLSAECSVERSSLDKSLRRLKRRGLVEHDGTVWKWKGKER